ncbi:hypothetical protein [Sphingobium nicotianae]|uniref:Uncharacterized protein n=1 Tax=Sphingobium nicotianae TaxID=2782607 RepID=A0A9X1DAS5_9SPHN|nr:hypothetical protein [Sphingobium nicotianae]MBT2186500.1 hypothetical protein [Sphingobium nicotianae]
MSNGKSEREQRLAQALRANLHRRKGQAREWGQDDAETASPPPENREPNGRPD